jgi:endonuclease G
MKKLLLILLLLPVIGFGQNYEPSLNGQLVRHTYYSLSYSEENEQAEWVYYKLTPEMLKKKVKRRDNYYSDTNIITNSASKKDYIGSKYHKGHLVPARNMLFSNHAMLQSFYMSNIAPQNSLFNNGIWSKLEDRIREWVKSEGEMHIVTGGVFSNNLGEIGSNHVTIPAYFYKIIYSEENNKMIGFIIPNKKNSSELKDLAYSVDSIESLTNINFFYQIDDEIENALESDKKTQDWTFK